jgi:2-aminoadipate transaminase
MRLNFSGVGDDDIREGVRRIGKVVREQVALYGTLTGAEPARRERRARDTAPPGDDAAGSASVLPLRRRARP